jgi:hypothetical protein
MPRAKLRKGGKWHEQHRLCCVTHSMRVRGLQSGELTCQMAWSTSAGASVRANNASEGQEHVRRTTTRRELVLSQGFRAYNVFLAI